MVRVQQLRKRTYEVLEVSQSGDWLSRAIDLMLMALIAGNAVAVILESIASLHNTYQDLFWAFEKISAAAFSAELILRIWAASENPKSEGGPWQKRLRYLTSPMAVIDALAILPFYLVTFFAIDLRILRILRLLRVVKFTRYSTAFRLIGDVFKYQRNALVTSLFLMGIAVVLAASILHVVESSAQPEAFGSIPAAMWWAICTLTTVGYGDVTPITSLGKTMAASISIIGIGFVALPTSIFTAGFAQAMARKEQTLADNARSALADGVFDSEEALTYAQLAESLHVEPETAKEVIEMVRLRQNLSDLSDCPHCGKTLDDEAPGLF
ncbi:MAG: ion transporter [Myxococcota bacterium]